MRNNFILIIFSLITHLVFAQVPEQMSYQAIVRNSSGDLITNTSVGVQISILENSDSGPAVYEETHTVTTNENGLLTLQIGLGSVVSGVFSEIDWSSNEYYILSETDIEGGSNYTITGVSQLSSVPYALQAKKADKLTGYKIGDFAHGGIVFWLDETGQHGLVCSKVNQSQQTKWFAGTFGTTRAKGDGLYSGKSNSNIIISSHLSIGDDSNDYAASLCTELGVVEDNLLYGDWYLPSAFELKLISQNISTINKTALDNGGENFIDGFYWSSTEVSNNNAKIVNINDSQESSVLKSSQNPVRAIRSF